MPSRFTITAIIATTVFACTVAACTSGGSSKAVTSSTSSDAGITTSSSAPATTAQPPKLSVLVTNDDGYGAPGIDTMVQALVKLPNVAVTVVAPMKNQSGTGGKTTNGALGATRVKTASGYPATAVDGFPADTITYALRAVLPAAPDLVVSGINNGQNVGPFIAISGTVGAAEAAATRGIPAIAASQGFGNPPDFASAARIVVSWIAAHRGEYRGGSHRPSEVVAINVPTCTTGSVRGTKQVPAATALAGRDITKVDCTSTLAAPADDVGAFLAGFATITELSTTGATVTATTTWNG